MRLHWSPEVEFDIRKREIAWNYLQTKHSPVTLRPSSRQVQQARWPQGVAVATLKINLQKLTNPTTTGTTMLTPRVPIASKHRGQRCPLTVPLSFTDELCGEGEVDEDKGRAGGRRRVCRMLRARCTAATPPSSRNTGPVLFSASLSSSSSSTLFTYSTPRSLLARW